MSKSRWLQLNDRIANCQQCSRLRDHCQTVGREKRRAYLEHDYWGLPVPNFGSAKVDLLIVGLAPGAHGANRTGRMFTGDRSGEWLFRALCHAGFANQAESIDAHDGLKLINCAITSICHCAPPDNKPAKDELLACQPFLSETIEICQPLVFMALGGLAWKATIEQLVETGSLESIKPQPRFSHGATVKLTKQRWLMGSYHPSQQNTFTGRLTEKMLDDVFANAKKLIANRSK